MHRQDRLCSSIYSVCQMVHTLLTRHCIDGATHFKECVQSFRFTVIFTQVYYIQNVYVASFFLKKLTKNKISDVIFHKGQYTSKIINKIAFLLYWLIFLFSIFIAKKLM
jgi:hypothetical protein